MANIEQNAAPSDPGGAEKRLDPEQRKLQTIFALVFIVAGALSLGVYFIADDDGLISLSESRTAVSLFLGMMLMSIGIAMVFYTIFDSSGSFKNETWKVGGALGIFVLLAFGLNTAAPKFYDPAKTIEKQLAKIEELNSRYETLETDFATERATLQENIGSLQGKADTLHEFASVYKKALEEGPRNIHFKVECHFSGGGRAASRGLLRQADDPILGSSAGLRGSGEIFFGTSLNGNIRPTETRNQRSTRPGETAVPIRFRRLLEDFEDMEDLNIFVFWHDQMNAPPVVNGVHIEVVPDGHQITLLLADGNC